MKKISLIVGILLLHCLALMPQKCQNSNKWKKVEKHK
jgi:hypothetical protein